MQSKGVVIIQWYTIIIIIVIITTTTIKPETWNSVSEPSGVRISIRPNIITFKLNIQLLL